MRNNRLEVYVHFIWSTWDREPRLTEKMRRLALRVIAAEVNKHHCDLLAINCMPDHVHLLVRLSSVICIADLVKQMKGVSSHALNEGLKPTTPFKWQGGNGPYSVCRWELPEVIQYINGQQAHHRENTVIAAYEEFAENGLV